MVYMIEELKSKIKTIADQYDIEEIYLFGSYSDGNATRESDVDLVVRYGDGCRGLNCIRFMNDLESALNKTVDVINIEYPPKFMNKMDFQKQMCMIYGPHKH